MHAYSHIRTNNSDPPTGDNEPLKAFYEKMKNDKLMQKPKFEHPVILRGNLLVHAHVLRLTNLLTPVRGAVNATVKHQYVWSLSLKCCSPVHHTHQHNMNELNYHTRHQT